MKPLLITAAVIGSGIVVLDVLNTYGPGAPSGNSDGSTTISQSLSTDAKVAGVVVTGATLSWFLLLLFP